MCDGIFFSPFQVNGTEIEYEFEEITLERVSQSGGPLTDSVTQLWDCTHIYTENKSKLSSPDELLVWWFWHSSSSRAKTLQENSSFVSLHSLHPCCMVWLPQTIISTHFSALRQNRTHACLRQLLNCVCKCFQNCNRYTQQKAILMIFVVSVYQNHEMCW